MAIFPLIDLFPFIKNCSCTGCNEMKKKFVYELIKKCVIYGTVLTKIKTFMLTIKKICKNYLQ